MKKFSLNSLPSEVRNKINHIEFFSAEEQEDTESQGEVFLKDGWVFDWDDSHTSSFVDKQDLIDIVNYCTRVEE